MIIFQLNNGARSNCEVFRRNVLDTLVELGEALQESLKVKLWSSMQGYYERYGGSSTSLIGFEM